MASNVTEGTSWVPVPGWDRNTPGDGDILNLSLVALVSRDGYILSAAQAAATAAATAQAAAGAAQATASAAQPGSATLTAFSGLSLATTGNVPYVSAAGILSMAATTSFGRSLWNAAAASNARTTLGLGNSATLAVGTAASTVAAGNDARFAQSNMLINTGVPINQTGFAGGALGAGVYGYDMWKAGTGGCNVTINATTGVFTHASGPLQQIVEAPELAWGVPVTFSVEDPSATLTLSIGGTAASITAGAGRRSATVTPSGSGNMTVQITATGATYSRPKLERGSVATTYVPRTAAEELALCQRYWQKSYDLAVAPGTASANGGRSVLLFTGAPSAVHAAGATVQFRTRMRATPTVTLYSHVTGASGQVRDSTANADTGGVVTAEGETGFFWYANTGTTSSANLEAQWAANARL